MHKLLNLADEYVVNRKIFKIAMVIMTMITAVPFLHVRVGGYVKFILVYGIAVIGIELLTGRIKPLFKDKSNLLLIGFCICYSITILINRELNLSENLKALIYMCVFFVLFYMMRPDRTKEALIKEIKMISAITVICTAVLATASFATFIFRINGHYLTEQGFIYYGMYENRLWGVYNPNTGSTLNAISILLSLGFVFTAEKKVITYVLNILNITLQSICMVLTGSRAANYVLYVMVATLAFITVYKISLERNIKKRFWNIAKSLIAAVVSVAVILGAFAVIRETVVYLPGLIDQQNTNNDADTENDDKNLITVLEKIDLTRLEEVEDREGGIFTGRLDIWGACFKALKESPLFGVSRENVYDAAGKYLDDLWKEHFNKGGTHNIYICILISSGLVGFLFMAAFAVITLVKTLSSFIKHFKDYNIWAFIPIILVLMFYITEFVESRILYQVGIFNVLFWVYIGYMVAFAKLYSKEKSQISNETGVLVE